jgi:UDP-glucose 4-epimerase
MVLPRFVTAALRGQPIEVHGDGRQSRCFCDVRDSAAALPGMLGTPACHGRVFNLGDDQPIQIIALAELVRDTLKSTSPIVLVPYAQAFGANFDDLRDRRPDLTRVRQTIGFKASIPLEQTIRDLAREISRRSGAPADSVSPSNHHHPLPNDAYRGGTTGTRRQPEARAT